MARGGITRYDGTVFQTLEASSGSELFDPKETAATTGSVWLFRYQSSLYGPSLVVENVSTDAPLGALKSVKTDTSKPQVSFSLKAVSLKTAPSHQLYRYRLLESADPFWKITRNREVTFSHLPVGDYTFEAQTVDSTLTIRRSWPSR
ncbi:MAG: triple tyrosine motif-containing protein [Verrucomicrobiota bacterium]